MRKLLSLAMAGVSFLVMSCDKDVTNPGDFSLKSELSMPDMLISSVDGQSYPIEIDQVIDTAYTSSYEKYDTTFEVDAEGKFVLDENGKKIPVIGPDGKYIIKTDTITFRTGKTGKFYKSKDILLNSFPDTFTIELKSNARWYAPQYASEKAQWFYNYNLRTGGNSLTGGGDSELYFRVTRNKNYKHVESAVQYIYTSDSTVMYRLNFVQAGESDAGNRGKATALVLGKNTMQQGCFYVIKDIDDGEYTFTGSGDYEVLVMNNVSQRVVRFTPSLAQAVFNEQAQAVERGEKTPKNYRNYYFYVTRAGDGEFTFNHVSQ